MTLLSAYLRQHKIPQNRLAALTGLDESRLNRICAGRFTAKPEEKSSICQALGVGAEQIFDPYEHLDKESQRAHRLAAWIVTGEGRLFLRRLRQLME